MPVYGVNLAITAGMTVVIQLAFFAIAYTKQFDKVSTNLMKVTDLSGGLNFLINGLIIFFLQSTYDTKQIITLGLLALWSIRLSGYLFYRVLVIGKDSRFDEMRADFWKFLGFWVFQILWVWIVGLPIVAINSSPLSSPITALDIIGIVVFILGFAIESIADIQKFAFKMRERQNSANPPFIKSGLWAYSRHPNYLGEILVWIGFFLISINSYEPSNVGIIFISLLSPVFTSTLLLFLSGVNLAEWNANKKFGKDQAYLLYREKTSPLIPLPNKLYSRISPGFKKIFFEWDYYRKNL